jgi:outer membrane biosynthesis protein TonB
MRLPRFVVSAFLSLVAAGLVPALAGAQPAPPAAASAPDKAAPKVSPTPPVTPPGTAPAKAPESAPAAPKGEPAPEATKRPPSPPSSNAPQRAAFAVKLGAPIPVSAIRKMASVEGITEYRLPNGLKVLLFPDPSKPTITVNITY